MESTHSLPPHFCVHAVVNYGNVLDSGIQHIQLLHQHDHLEAWTWLPPESAEPNRVLKARVLCVPVDTHYNANYVVVSLTSTPELDVFDLIPDDFGVTGDMIYRCRDVVDACTTPALRHFLSDVFSIPRIYRYFWTCPASRNHHHAYAGGLAQHSLEMAEQIRDMPNLKDLDRDIGMAYALTHDLGKIWCLDGNTAHLQAMGHELVGLAKLHGPLMQLERNWPEGATAMRSLLAGRWKHRGFPLMAVGSLVRGLDQASAEADLRPRQGHRFQPWTPSLPSTDNVIPLSSCH